jgi:hypothetical protein
MAGAEELMPERRDLPSLSACIIALENAAERDDFAVGLNDVERRFLADQIKQRLSVR